MRPSSSLGPGSRRLSSKTSTRRHQGGREDGPALRRDHQAQPHRNGGRRRTSSTCSSPGCCSASSPRTPASLSAAVFTNAIGSLHPGGRRDMPDFLDRLFERPGHTARRSPAMSQPHLRALRLRQRQPLPPRVTQRPNSRPRPAAVILECGTLDWSQINPDIFGSMIQAVVTPSQREGLGSTTRRSRTS